MSLVENRNQCNSFILSSNKYLLNVYCRFVIVLSAGSNNRNRHKFCIKQLTVCRYREKVKQAVTIKGRGGFGERMKCSGTTKHGI